MVKRPLVLVAALAALLWLVTPASPLAAHSGLIDTSPPASSVLERAPQEIRLVFAQTVETRLASIELFDANASKILIGSPVRDPSDRGTIVATVPPIELGLYVVVWRILSADGHPTDGAFTFQVGSEVPAVDVNVLLARATAGGDADTTVGWLLGLSRWVGMLGLVALVGGAGLATVCRAPRERWEMVRRVLWTSWGLVLAGSVGVLVLQGPYVTRRGMTEALDVGLWGEVLGTRTGRAIEFRWAFLLAAGWLVVLWHRSATRWWRAGAAVIAVGLAATFSFAGHPASTRGGVARAVFATSIDTVHLLGTAVWLGGLAMLLAVGGSWAWSGERTSPVRRYSRWATVALPLVVVTGVVQAVLLSQDLGTVTDLRWGRLLIVKLAVVVLVVALAAAARWLLYVDGPSSLRRLLGVELLLGVVVVALAAGLVATPPQGDSAARPFHTTLTSDGVLLDLTLTPARPGPNEVHLLFVPPGGSLQQVTGATAEVIRGDERIVVDLAFAGPNHWSGLVRLPYAGPWRLEVSAVGTDGVTRRYSADVSVEG